MTRGDTVLTSKSSLGTKVPVGLSGLVTTMTFGMGPPETPLTGLPAPTLGRQRGNTRAHQGCIRSASGSNRGAPQVLKSLGPLNKQG